MKTDAIWQKTAGRTDHAGRKTTRSYAKRRPLVSYPLLFLLLLLSASGIFGGLNLLIDPQGDLILLPVALLENTPFTNYLLPGMMVLLLHGVFPLFITYALLKRPDWQWPDAFNIYPDQYWAWTFALYEGIILITWINVQTVLIGYLNFVQTFYSLFGVALLVATLVPQVKSYYARPAS